MARQITLTPPRGGIVYLTVPDSGAILQPGALGFGAPPRQFWTDTSPVLDGALLLGMRRGVRELSLPVYIEAADAVSCLAAYRALARSLAPEFGATLISTAEADTSDPRTIQAYFTGGLEGDDSVDANGQVWRKFVLSFETFGDPYWNGAAQHQAWKSDAAVPFFPILPVKLAPSQILSGLTTASIHNYVPNPSFEVSAASWVTNALGTAAGFARSVTHAQVGSASLLITWPTAGSGGSGVGQFINGLVIGQQYTFSAYVWVPTGSPVVAVDVFGAATSTASTIFDAFQRLSVVFTATSTSHFVEVVLKAAATAGQQVWVDAAMLSDGAVLQTYGDGNSGGGWTWLGAADLSASVKPAAYDTTQIITNPGDAPAYPVWTITGPGAGVLLTNQDTGEYLSLAATISPGQLLTIDTRPQVASIVDNTGVNYWPSLSSGSSLWALRPGDNHVALVVTGTTSASELDLDYATRYETA